MGNYAGHQQWCLARGKKTRTHTDSHTHWHTHRVTLEVVEKSQRLTLNSDNIFALHGKCRGTKAHRMAKREEGWWQEVEVRMGEGVCWRGETASWGQRMARESHKATDNRTCNRWLLWLAIIWSGFVTSAPPFVPSLLPPPPLTKR